MEDKHSKETGDALFMKRLCEYAVGELAVKYLEGLPMDALLSQMESKALELLAEIKGILDDKTLEDPACFRRIEAIVEAYETRGIPVARHDW